MTSEIKVDTISEQTSANGVAIDSVTLKDGGITTTGAVGIGTSSLQPFLVNGARGSGMGSYPTWETTTGRNLALFETDQSEGSFVLGSPTNGYAQLGFADPASKASGRVGYDHSSDAMIFGTNGGTEAMRIDSAGHVTKPLQPCVLAYSSSAQNDIATGVVTINLDAEVYDVNADFNTSNYTFTAPVTGKYMCSGQIVMTDVDTAFQWIYGRFNTSNRIYYMALIDPRIEITQDGGHTWTFSALVDMDANDTLVLDTRSSAHGAAQNNITSGTATALETFMTVYLAA